MVSSEVGQPGLLGGELGVRETAAVDHHLELDIGGDLGPNAFGKVAEAVRPKSLPMRTSRGKTGEVFVEHYGVRDCRDPFEVCLIEHSAETGRFTVRSSFGHLGFFSMMCRCKVELLMFDVDGHQIDKRENRLVLTKAM